MLMDYLNGKNDLIPVGTYEAVIVSAEAKTFRSGSEGHVMEVRIREDIHPEQEGVSITDHLVYKKGGGLYKYNQLLVALPEGIDYMWDTLEELADYFLGQTIRVNVNHRKNDYRERIENHISGYSKSFLDPDAEEEQEGVDCEEASESTCKSVVTLQEQDSKWADQWEIDEWAKEQNQLNKFIEQDWEWDDQWSIDEWLREMSQNKVG